MCGLAHCHDEGPKKRRSPGGLRGPFFLDDRRLPSKKKIRLPSVPLAQTPCGRFPWNQKNNQQCSDPRFAHAGLFGARRSTVVPLGTLPFGFRVVFKSHDSSLVITKSRKSGSTCSLPKFNAKLDAQSLLNFSLHRES